MKIIQKKIEDLIPYEFNNKIHWEQQINQIANSIKEFWFTQPIVIDKNNIVVIWHGRLEASKKLWLEEVPCYIVDELNEKQIKKLRILDNKLNESERDIGNLKLELDEIGDMNFWDLEMEITDLFPEPQEKWWFQNQEIEPDDLWNFQHKCPKCWFEFNE